MYFLGTHEPSWLTRSPVPLFLSARRLRRYKKLPWARCPWAIDSGGFSELNLYGTWKTSPATYAAEVRGWADAGRLRWAAIQDWMCEPFVLEKTGKTLREHQDLTVASWRTLTGIDPSLPWCPVVQGFTLAEYRDCVKLYEDAGTDLRTLPVVGLGSICRRQATKEAAKIIEALASDGLKLHAFGLKTQGIPAVKDFLTSADSMAWSFAARYEPPLPGHTHKTCANCIAFAIKWYHNVEQAAGGFDNECRPS